MKKEFDINEILLAIDSIAKSERNKKEIKKDYINNNDNIAIKKPAKTNKSTVLVLSEMIE